MTGVNKLTLQLRAPRRQDGGKVQIGYWCVADGYVVLTDDRGRPTGDGKRLINEGDDPKLLAVALMKAHRRNSASPHGWNDRLHYQKLRY